MGRGQLLGEDDILLGSPTYRSSAQCVSMEGGEVYQMDRDMFEKLRNIGGQQAQSTLTAMMLQKRSRVKREADRYNEGS
jgi:CRP-like cAMP-binding protein